MADTNIEWTQRPGTIGAVWNPTTGCDKISDGCTNCYALTYGYDGNHPALPNTWLGTSIESDQHAGRADVLRATPAAVRFISAEPLLGPLPSLNLAGVDWLIIGGESGPGSRPLDLGWVRELVDKARDAGTAVFVKQLGTVWARDTWIGGEPVARADVKGGHWENWPTDLRVREYPAGRVAVTA